MSIDPSALEAYRDFMGEEADAFIAWVVNSFIENAPKLITTMEQASMTGDPDSFVRAAHTLKSNSATIGAHQLSSMAEQLEELGKSNPLNELGLQVTRAKNELGQVLKELSHR